MTNKRPLASIVCTVLLVLLVALPVSSWVMLAMGMPVNNVLCAEGYRWLWLHTYECLAPSYILPVLALVVLAGCVLASGIVTAVRRTHRTVNEKMGLTAATTIFIVLFAGFMVPVFRVDSAMRSVTGHLFPSPWFSSVPYLLCVITFLSMLSYCLLARRERFHIIVGMLLSEGLQRFGLWLINISLLNFLVEIGKYIFAS